MNTKLTKIISGLFVATAAFQTASAGNITDIKVSSLPNKQKIVKVSFDKEIVNPTGFVTSSPARIALDFEQTGISMDQQVICRSPVEQNQCRTKQQPCASGSESEQTGPIQYRSTREQSLDIH